MRELILLLGQLSLQTAIIIAMVLGLRAIFRRRLSPGMRYALWALPLARLLFPFSPPAPTSVMNALPQGMSVTPDITFTGGGAVPLAAGQTGAAASFPWTALLFWVWIAGIGVVLGYMLWLNLRLHARLSHARPCRQADRPTRTLCRSLGIKRAPAVYSCEGLASPCLMGLFRPRIYVNAAALQSPERLHYVLLHELNHLRQRDPLWAVLRNMALAIYWFHPLVWVAAFASRQDSELACDARSLKTLNDTDATQYGMALLSLLRPSNKTIKAQDALGVASSVAAGKREMKERIGFIAKRPRRSTLALTCTLVLIAAAALTACTTAMATQPEPTPSPDAVLEDGTPAATPSPLPQEETPAPVETPTSAPQGQIELLPERDDAAISLYVTPTGLYGGSGYYLPEGQDVLRDLLAQAKAAAQPEEMPYKTRLPIGMLFFYQQDYYELTDDGCIVAYLWDESQYATIPAADAKALYGAITGLFRSDLGILPFHPEAITGLTSATLSMPADANRGIAADLIQTITDPSALQWIETHFRDAEIIIGGSGCPFGAMLTLTLQSGETIDIAIATDSCPSYMVNGLYFDYRDGQTGDAQNAFFALFSDIPNPNDIP